MPPPVTLFTGQWADLPLDVLCAKVKLFGNDGAELACWGGAKKSRILKRMRP